VVEGALNETQPASADSATVRRKARRTLALIAAVCIAPVVASYAIYYLFPRDVQVNYGTLLPTAPAPALAGALADGAPFRLDALRGRWVLVILGGERCGAACDRILYATRQARTMQGKEQDRIVRVLVLAGDALPNPGVLAEHPGVIVVRAPAASSAYPGAPGATYLVDPLGNLVLRYSEDPDIKGIARDLGRLLKASRIG
jgi:cytochrome oxidase Cu insertion factor (SCO1/SenC/PrrC family)